MTETLEHTAIKTSIGKIESFAQFVHLENEEIMINHFLDKINIFTKDLIRLTDLINDLDSELHANFNKFTVDVRASLITILPRLSQTAIKLHKALEKSPYEKGLRTANAKFKLSIDNIDEFVCDLETAESLKGDDEYNSIIDALIG